MTPYNYFTNETYSGRNLSTLTREEFADLGYATFLQWKKAGYSVKKGSKGFPIAVFKPTTKKNKEGKIVESTAVMSYYVFNVEQVEKIN